MDVAAHMGYKEDWVRHHSGVVREKSNRGAAKAQSKQRDLIITRVQEKGIAVFLKLILNAK